MPAANADGPSAIEDLARLAHGHRFDELPAVVVREARHCLLDTLGCILAGTRAPDSAMITRSLLDSEPGTFAAFGTDSTFSLRGATLVNGYHGDVLELNDLVGGHASIGNISAALSLLQLQALTGRQLIESIVAGIETTWRVYSAVYADLKPFSESGLVPVGLPSALGAAAVAARVLQLDPDRTAHALAIAGATAGWCPAEVIFGAGGTVKPLLFGAQPAITGIDAARYAQAGMTGPLRLLESKLGYFPTMVRQGRKACLPPKDAWGLEQPRRKLHACCGYIHSAVDALGLLSDKLAELPGPVDITVAVPPYVAEVISKSALPRTANDARFHLQYCLALVASGQTIIEPDHILEFQRHLAVPAIAGALERIEVVAQDTLTHYQACEITIREASGRARHHLAFDSPRGSPARPLDTQELVRKFRSITRGIVSERQGSRLIDQILHLEDLHDAREVLRALTTP